MSSASRSDKPASSHSRTSDDDLRKLGHRVAERRAEPGLTLAALAEAVGVHHSTLSRLEGGAQDLGASRLPSLARALDLEVSALFPPD